MWASPIKTKIKNEKNMTEKRENVIRFRVNKQEMEAIEKRAIGSVSSWLRDLALNEPEKRKPKPINPELLFHLNKIGVNLNQIARYCNRQAIFESADKIDLLFVLAAIEDELKELRQKYDR